MKLNTKTYVKNAGELQGWDEEKVLRFEKFLIKVGAYPTATHEKFAQACTDFIAQEGLRPPKGLPMTDQ